MNKIDKIIEHFRNLREDGGVPTMNTGTSNGSPGFSAYANSKGPVAGLTPPLDGRTKILKRLPPLYRFIFNKTNKKNKKNK